MMLSRSLVLIALACCLATPAFAGRAFQWAENATSFSGGCFIPNDAASGGILQATRSYSLVQCPNSGGYSYVPFYQESDMPLAMRARLHIQTPAGVSNGTCAWLVGAFAVPVGTPLTPAFGTPTSVTITQSGMNGQVRRVPGVSGVLSVTNVVTQSPCGSECLGMELVGVVALAPTSNVTCQWRMLEFTW